MWPLLLLGLAGLALSASGKSAPKLRGGIRLPVGPGASDGEHGGEADLPPPPISEAEFEAELDSRLSRLAMQAREWGVSFTDKKMFSSQAASVTVAIMLGFVTPGTPISAEAADAMDRYEAGHPFWDAYAPLISPEERDFWIAFAQYGTASLDSAAPLLPSWAAPLSFAFGNDPNTAKGRAQTRKEIEIFILGTRVFA